jgi:hypothetical protein
VADLHVVAAAAEFLKAEVAAAGTGLDVRAERAGAAFDLLVQVAQVQVVNHLAVRMRADCTTARCPNPSMTANL